MGTCASVHNGTAPESAMKLGVSFSSKKDKLVTPESPINDNKHSTANPPIKTFGDFGSKEESFFDSRAWIDSDCEDDFYSVNGDFTPSRGNTPVHHNFAAGTPQANKNPCGGQALLVLNSNHLQLGRRDYLIFSKIGLEKTEMLMAYKLQGQATKTLLMGR
ncbi:hypothetical protein OIU84_024956 [Salix udensis]|uniref:Uncharacterized protein n=1 Tax=Salix udensis TaxID=889485 RepID=A0AAD6KJT5_9ROSI|nr:hypothetical protein OIU84_024956 [Salix udensis]